MRKQRVDGPEDCQKDYVSPASKGEGGGVQQVDGEISEKENKHQLMENQRGSTNKKNDRNLSFVNGPISTCRPKDNPTLPPSVGVLWRNPAADLSHWALKRNLLLAPGDTVEGKGIRGLKGEMNDAGVRRGEGREGGGGGGATLLIHVELQRVGP